MLKRKNPRIGRGLRHKRVRRRIFGQPSRPRLAVYRSSVHIYAQIIDDVAQKTLAAASSLDPDLKSDLAGKNKVDESKLVGSLLAKRATAKGISQVVFDRGGFLYHGRVKALADGAREGGLVF